MVPFCFCLDLNPPNVSIEDVQKSHALFKWNPIDQASVYRFNFYQDSMNNLIGSYSVASLNDSSVAYSLTVSDLKPSGTYMAEIYALSNEDVKSPTLNLTFNTSK